MADNKYKKTVIKPIERVVIKDTPWYAGRLIKEHKQRYFFCAELCKNKTVLDIACGSGYGSYILAQSGAKKVYGIDNDGKNVIEAKKEYFDKKITFIMSDAHSIPLNSSAIDIIVSLETIEHLEKPKKFLEEAYRLLKPDGLLILSTPNRETSYEDNPFHLKEYTFIELDKLLTKFPDRKFYGQRAVNKYIIKLYKGLYKRISRIRMLNFLSFFLRFRPWEKLEIVRMKDNLDTNYLYFIVICKK